MEITEKSYLKNKRRTNSKRFEIISLKGIGEVVRLQFLRKDS